MPDPVVIVGTAEGRCVLETCQAAGLAVAGFVDLVDPARGPVNGCPVLGGEDLLCKESFLRSHRFVVTLGDGARRRALSETIRENGGVLVRVIHPNAHVSPHARLGQGVVCLGFNAINPNCRIGDAVILDWQASVGHDSVLGDGVFLAPGVHLGGRVRLGADVFVGLGAVVVPDATIGAGSLIGAGAAVVGDIPPGVVAVGNPARVIKQRRSAYRKTA